MKRLILALAALFVLAAPAMAQDRSPKVIARLVAEDLAVAPGGTVSVALEEKIRAGWHTYWINPGDVGTPTMIQWSLPAGWTAGPIQWPAPKRLPVAGFMDYGYEGTVWLISDLHAPADAKVGDTVTLKAAASWLVCQQVCVPEDRDLTLTVKVGAKAPDPAMAKDFAAARAKMPVASPWTLTYAAGSVHIDLYAKAPQLAAAHPKDASFFPAGPGLILNPAPQQIGFAKDGLVLRLAPGPKAASLKGPLQGVLVMTSSDGSVQALAVDAAAGVVPAADFPAGSGGEMSVGLAILLAFLGGLILNVMPCVLPILAMKALAVAGHSTRERHEARLEGLSYAAGAVLSFLAFGLAIVALRAGGAAIGWGFQLQAPLAVAGFTLLMFAVGLNLSGLFEVGTISAGGGLAAKGGAAGAFFTGVLAVAVAAPCTGPFMATALGFALTQSAFAAMAIFAGLGLGFALPFLILGFWPRALSFLPKPGPWMLRLKQFLAFPMYGAAVFFAGVLAQETGATGVMVLLGAAVAVALAGWLWSVTRDLSARGRAMGLMAVLLVLAAGAYGLSLLPGTPTVSAASSTAGADHFTPEKLASLRAANKPVFIDATAAWCITCLVNEQAVLSRPKVKSAFAARNVTYLVADWTNNDPAVTKLLSDNGRSGVPLYLYYAPGAAPPVILPQILTENEVLKTIGGQ